MKIKYECVDGTMLYFPPKPINCPLKKRTCKEFFRHRKTGYLITENCEHIKTKDGDDYCNAPIATDYIKSFYEN